MNVTRIAVLLVAALAAVTPTLITRDMQPDLGKAVEGAVVRAPLVAGEPVTAEKIVRAGNASFMAATIAPGKRAVSIAISPESGVGGFILPNDRVTRVAIHRSP
jgi:pilus assembly protein CpaB